MRRKRNIYWGAVVLDWFRYLQDNELASSDYKVLFYLCEIMDHKRNIAYTKQKLIAEHLLMDKGSVSRSIKKLTKMQFIFKVENGIMINPHLFYVGMKHREDREDVRAAFDQVLEKKSIIPRFNLNEDDSCLDVDTEFRHSN